MQCEPFERNWRWSLSGSSGLTNFHTRPPHCQWSRWGAERSDFFQPLTCSSPWSRGRNKDRLNRPTRGLSAACTRQDAGFQPRLWCLRPQPGISDFRTGLTHFLGPPAAPGRDLGLPTEPDSIDLPGARQRPVCWSHAVFTPICGASGHVHVSFIFVSKPPPSLRPRSCPRPGGIPVGLGPLLLSRP